MGAGCAAAPGTRKSRGGSYVVQSAQSAATPYFVPAAGFITQWQTHVTGDTAGAPLTFAVVRPISGGDFTVVGTDNETIPNPLPASGIASFTLTTPIAVQVADTFALYTTSAGVNCYVLGGSTPSGDNLVSIADAAPPPATGQTLTSPVACSGGCALNVAASFSQSEDAGVTTSAAPSNATAGNQALLSSTVSNAGPSPGPIRFTETVPTGVTINAAAAGEGTCSTSGQNVTCAITGLAPGQSAPVDVVVTPTAAGTYATSVSVAVSSPLSDPNAANDTGSATLTVHALPPAPVAHCVVPKLNAIRLPFAKQVVHLLGCAAGPVRKVHSKSIHKGLVIHTNPGPGTYANGSKIAFVVSAGPRRKHHK
jgi:hypothetical protein